MPEIPGLTSGLPRVGAGQLGAGLRSRVSYFPGNRVKLNGLAVLNLHFGHSYTAPALPPLPE